MPLLDIPNREQLDGPARDALESVLANIIGYLYTEHDDEGSHKDVTADSLTVREGGIVTLPNGTTIATDGTTEGTATRIDATGPVVITTPGVNNNALLRTDFEFGQLVPLLNTVQHASEIPMAMPGIRFTPQGEYAVASNDLTALFEGGVSNPSKTYWRLTSTGDKSIHGIYTAGVVSPGHDGQFLVLVNDSDYTITFTSGVVTDARKILSSDVVLNPGGAVGIVYDVADLGWRIVWVNNRILPAAALNASKIPRTLFSRNGTDQNVSTGATNVFDKTIPANTFDTDGQSIHWVASGAWTANANTKQVDPKFDGISLVALGPAVINTAGARWWFDAHIHRANSTNMQCVLHFVTHNAAGVIVTNSVFTTDSTMDWTAAIDLDLFLDGDATGDITVNYSKVVFYPEGT